MTASETRRSSSETDESKAVGQKGREGDESTGHPGPPDRRGCSATRTWTNMIENDLAHMRKVVGYIHRHGAQHPDGEALRRRPGGTR